MANFMNNVKHVSIEDETNKEKNLSQNDVVIFPGYSDEDSFFGLRSMASKKKYKENNIKLTESVSIL